MSSPVSRALAARALGVALLCVGILAMHGFTSVATEHGAEIAARAPAMVLDGAPHVVPFDGNEDMGVDIHMLAVCIGVILTSIGTLSLVCAYARVRPLGGAGALGTTRHPLAAFAGRSPPLRLTPVQFVVLLT